MAPAGRLEKGSQVAACTMFIAEQPELLLAAFQVRFRGSPNASAEVSGAKQLPP